MARAVVFDYGGTLVTFSYPRAELEAALDAIRPSLPAAAPSGSEVVERILRPLESLLDEPGDREVDYEAAYARAWAAAGCELDDAQRELAMDVEQRVWNRAAEVAPGTRETLDELRRRGVLTGIASNAPFPARFLHRQLSHVGIEVDCARFSSEVGRRKPNPALYLAVMTCLGVEPADVLFVGDRVDLDYEVPRALGMRALLVSETPPAGVASISTIPEVLDHVGA